MKKKRRAPGVGCRNPGRKACRRDAVTTVDGKRLCAKHAADRLFNRAVRESGSCFAVGYVTPSGAEVTCSFQMECCHIITSARLPTRWSFDNAVPMCSGHHVWFTHHPNEWRAFIEGRGIDYDELHRRAWNDEPMDPLAVIEELETV